MSLLIASALLAALWVLATEETAPFNFLIGFAFGYAILRALKIRLPLAAVSPRRIFKMTILLIYFLKELIIANVTMAYYVLSPLDRVRPAIVGVPIAPNMTDTEISLLANLITLTPGTLSVDVSPDKSTLYIHAMHVTDIESFRRSVRLGFERRVLEAMR